MSVNEIKAPKPKTLSRFDLSKTNTIKNGRKVIFVKTPNDKIAPTPVNAALLFEFPGLFKYKKYKPKSTFVSEKIKASGLTATIN
jgi:hypothetical protein